MQLKFSIHLDLSENWTEQITFDVGGEPGCGDFDCPVFDSRSFCDPYAMQPIVNTCPACEAIMNEIHTKINCVRNYLKYSRIVAEFDTETNSAILVDRKPFSY